MKLRILKTLFFVLTVLMFSSCYRNIRYIVDDKTQLPHEYIDTVEDYHIKVGDIIGIALKTTNSQINSLFVSDQGKEVTHSGFEVSDTGYIHVPIFGDIFVLDKTIKEIRQDIQKMVDEKLIDAVVSTRLMNFNVYFLGVQNGMINFSDTKVSILEAVARHGGVTYDAKRRKIIIIRKTVKGYLLYKVDITDRKLMEATQFYLQPGDMIYVEPRRLTAFKRALNDYSAVLTIFTSGMSLYYLIERYVK